MNLQVYARETPMFDFQPGSVKLSLLGAVKAFAILPNSTLIPLFKLNAVSVAYVLLEALYCQLEI